MSPIKLMVQPDERQKYTRETDIQNLNFQRNIKVTKTKFNRKGKTNLDFEADRKKKKRKTFKQKKRAVVTKKRKRKFTPRKLAKNG